MNLEHIDQVPWLRSGSGNSPSDGGCILQVIDWIDRHKWSDHPKCVHPVIREVAIFVNDRVSDDERQKLLDLAPRIMGTSTGGQALTRHLMGWLARQVYPLWVKWMQSSGYDDHGAVKACIEAAERGKAADAAEAARAADAARAAEAAWAADAAWAAWAADAAWAAWAADAARAADAAWAAWAARAAEAADAARAAWAARAAAPTSFDLLVGLLDRYDELTLRTSIEPMDFREVCAVMAERS